MDLKRRTKLNRRVFEEYLPKLFAGEVSVKKFADAMGISRQLLNKKIQMYFGSEKHGHLTDEDFYDEDVDQNDEDVEKKVTLPDLSGFLDES